MGREVFNLLGNILGNILATTFTKEGVEATYLLSLKSKQLDIYCQHCGEGFSVYHVNHDMEPEFREMFLAGKGCDCCEGKGEKDNSLRSEAMGLMMDMMGDDIDGVASMMDDFDYFDMLDE